MHIKRLAPLLCLSAITILFYWKILLVYQFSMLLGYEGANQAYAWFSFWVNTVRQGTLPLWDPYTFSGHVFSGEMQTGAFYPPYLWFLLDRSHGAVLSVQLYHYFYVLTHIACGYFMYKLAREMSLSVGWRATVNGHPAEVLRVDGGFRGVIVPNGKSHVVMCYRPMSFYLGMISSLGSFLCGGMLVLLRTDRARRLPWLRSGARRLQAYRCRQVVLAARYRVQ